MGDVYLAENTRLGLKVALKFLAAQLTRDEKAIKRLEHEARAVAELSHPNISRIYDIEEADGQRFLVLEYLEGETLSERIQRGPLPIDETIRIGKALAEGLSHAHARGIVHRDIKASNVMLTTGGGVKIMDFGLAWIPDTTRLTESGEWLGTVPNMSPEQASGAVADARSDLWSLGVVLYQCVTGRFPFEGDSAFALISRIRSDPVAPPTSLRTGVPLDLDRTILRCLEKDPSLRFQTAEDLLAELRRLQAPRANSMSDATTIAISTPKRLGRKRQWAALISIVVIATSVVIWRSMTSTRPSVFDDGTETAAASQRPNWILVADFDGPSDQPGLAAAARELVVSSLAQSDVVTPLSRSDLLRGLKLAVKPDTTRIVGEVARELAMRAAARTYVEGRVDAILRGFSVVLSLKDSETGHIVTSVSRVFESGEQLISGLDRMSTELRTELGEHAASLRATRMGKEVYTPSFEAFMHYIRAGEFLGLGDNEGCVDEARRGLELDPEFASLWHCMGVCANNLGDYQLSQHARRRAFDHRDRLTDRDRILVDQQFLDSYQEQEWVYQRAAVRFPFDPAFHNNRGVTLGQLGRYDEEYECYRRANQVAPFGPIALVTGNELKSLIVLGRYDEAKRLVETSGIDGLGLLYWTFLLSLAQSRFDEADSVAALRFRHPDAGPRSRDSSRLYRACLLAARGSFSGSTATIAQIESSGSSERVREAASVDQSSLAILAGHTSSLPRPIATEDSSSIAMVLRALRFVAFGEVERAKSMIEVVRSRDTSFERRVLGVDLDVMDGLVAAAQGDWKTSERILESTARGGPEPIMLGRLVTRWTLARVYEQLGDPVLAAQVYEQLVSPVRFTSWNFPYRMTRWAFYSTFAHQRLVVLYSQMGRVEDARRHWEIFEQRFTSPDAELRPLMDEARQALAVAQAEL